MILDSIYKKVPIFIQNLIINLYALYLKFTRYSNTFKSELSDYKNNLSDWNTKSLDLKIKEDLVEFLSIASKNQFWKKRFSDYRVEFSDSGIVLQELRKLPILSKEEAKSFVDEIDNSQNIGEKIKLKKTGGTTGSALKFPQTISSTNKQWAIWWRYRNMHGIERNKWCGWFGGKMVVPIQQKEPPFYRKDYIGKQVLFSPLHLSKNNALHYYNTISKEKLTWLHGYPSQISLLASYVIDLNLEPISTLEIITIGAENLTERQKALITKAFKVPVRQHYGLAEGVANISEWPDGNMRIDKDFCHVDFVSTEDPEIYKIVGTNFTNPAFPLIRYDTGDLAKITHESGEVIVKEILGRSEDYVMLPNGNRFGPMNLVFKNLGFIREAQVFQPNINTLIFRIVKSSGYDENGEEGKLLDVIEKRLNDDTVKIEFEYFENLQRTKSGKLKTVISNI